MKKEEKQAVTDVSTKSRKKYVAEKKNVKKEAVNEVKEEVKEKKNGNVFKRIGGYFSGVAKEIKRIRWTNRKDLVKYSVATVVFVLFFGLYFYVIDWIVLLVRSLAK